MIEHFAQFIYSIQHGRKFL